MSRTYKDRPYKLDRKDESFDVRHERVEKLVEYYSKYTKQLVTYRAVCYIPKAGVLRKKKRQYVERHRMSTPMWWIHEMMQVPQRRAGREWERQVLHTNPEDLDCIDMPNVSRKPHIYFW